MKPYTVQVKHDGDPRGEFGTIATARTRAEALLTAEVASTTGFFDGSNGETVRVADFANGANPITYGATARVLDRAGATIAQYRCDARHARPVREI